MEVGGSSDREQGIAIGWQELLLLLQLQLHVWFWFWF